MPRPTERLLHALLRTPDAGADADLLARFVADRDGDAFAALVHRHGSVVYGVCRRVLRNHADAEDAFQATFLVLARKANAVRPRSAVGGWLHGVAFRVSMEARRAAAVRRVKERRAAEMKHPAFEPTDAPPDLRDVLDRELDALPEVYRSAVLACDLEGLSRRAAAERLGWSEGTLSGRLARARAILARRLAARGLCIPAAGLALLAGPTPAGLAESTVRIGILVAAGEGIVPAPVAALTQGVMKAMLVTKLKTLTAGLVVGCAVLVTAAAGYRADAAGAGDPLPADAARKPAAPRKAAGENDRIAELERERDRLLKGVAELKDKVANLEAGNKDAVVAAGRVLQYAPAMDAARRAEEITRRDAERNAVLPALPPADKPAPKPDKPASKPDKTTPVRDTAPPTPASPATPSRPSAPADVKPVLKVYQVEGLVADDKAGEALVKVVKATVEPGTWGTDAGVEYLPGQKSLVVLQTPKGHEAVAELLKLLKTLNGRK